MVLVFTLKFFTALSCNFEYTNNASHYFIFIAGVLNDIKFWYFSWFWIYAFDPEFLQHAIDQFETRFFRWYFYDFYNQIKKSTWIRDKIMKDWHFNLYDIKNHKKRSVWSWVWYWFIIANLLGTFYGYTLGAKSAKARALFYIYIFI